MTKNRKIIFGSELSEKIMILDYTKKMTKHREKIIFGSELSEAINKPFFRLYQKVTKNQAKKSKNYCWVRIVCYMSSSVANNQHLQLTLQLILHIFPAKKIEIDITQKK